jgi:murein DD-endopeptidase MepM/ murein hydrolase activator NlpD
VPPPARPRPTPLRHRPLAAAVAALALGLAAWAPLLLALPALASPTAAIVANPPGVGSRAPLSAGRRGWPPAGAGLAPLLTGPAVRSQGAGRVPALRLPLRGPVVRGFEPPSGPFGPGHRGIDLAAPLGSPVAAPAAGRVAFAGLVAGLGWVSLEVAPGVVVTVGPLDRSAPTAGRPVPALARLGRLAPGHGGRLHLGLRLDGAYVDPLPYLAGVGPPRLAPLPLPG